VRLFQPLTIFAFFCTLFIGAEAFCASQKAILLDYRYPSEVCGLVSMPGDFLLQVRDEDQTLSEFFEQRMGGADQTSVKWGSGALGVLGYATKELLSLNDPFTMNYDHAEVVSEIKQSRNIVTWSFYRAGYRADGLTYKKYHDADTKYRSDIAVFRPVTLTATKRLKIREGALHKVENRNYFRQKGFCSDFVNWAYDDIFTSWWNFLPVASRTVKYLYPFETIATPDDLADSLHTKKVCEIRNLMELTYPKYTCTTSIARQIYLGRDSENQNISEHSKNIEKYLIEKRIINENYDILIPKIYFKKPIPQKERLAAAKVCKRCKQRVQNYRNTRSKLSRSCKKACEKGRFIKCPTSL
jgi:hypothetical protein